MTDPAYSSTAAHGGMPSGVGGGVGFVVHTYGFFLLS